MFLGTLAHAVLTAGAAAGPGRWLVAGAVGDDQLTCEPPLRTVTSALPRLEAGETVAAGERFADVMATRRTIRDFAPDPVPAEAISQAVRAAASAPSSALDQ